MTGADAGLQLNGAAGALTIGPANGGTTGAAAGAVTTGAPNKKDGITGTFGARATAVMPFKAGPSVVGVAGNDGATAISTGEPFEVAALVGRRRG